MTHDPHPGFMDQGASTIFHQMSVKEASVYGGTEGTSMSGSGPQGDTQGDEDDGICIYIYTWNLFFHPLFWGLNRPPDFFSNQNKGYTWVSRTYIFIHNPYDNPNKLKDWDFHVFEIINQITKNWTNASPSDSQTAKSSPRLRKSLGAQWWLSVTGFWDDAKERCATEGETLIFVTLP